MKAKEFLSNLGLEDQKIKNNKSGSDWTIEKLLERYHELNNIEELQHHKDTTIGLYATDKNVKHISNTLTNKINEEFAFDLKTFESCCGNKA